MKTTLFLLVVLTLGLLVACNRSESTNANVTVSTNMFAFEGIYSDTNYDDGPHVSFKSGRYEGGLPTNPGGDMKGSGTYTVREIEKEKWELDLKFDLGGNGTIAVRKDGNDIWIRDTSHGSETKLIRK